jgi:hypothetical protein
LYPQRPETPIFVHTQEAHYPIVKKASNPHLSRQNWHRASLLVIKCCERITYNKKNDSPYANTVYDSKVFF